MYHKKDKLAGHLYEIIDNLMVGEEGKEISIDKLLSPSQKYSLIMALINGLPKTNFEMILEFNKTFKVEKETTHVIADWGGGELAFRLILEEALELANGLGLSKGTVYHIFLELYDKAMKDDKPSIKEVLDALLDLLYVTYRGFYVFNLTDIAYEGMEEVHASNMSKLIPANINTDKLTEIVADLRERGFPVKTVDTKNGYIMFQNTETGKVLKPKTYQEADLGKLIFNHLKTVK